MKAIVSNSLEAINAPAHIAKILKKNLTIPNQKWHENFRQGRSNYNVQKILRFWSKSESGSLILPRGYARQLIILCREHSEPCEIVDNRRLLPEIDFQFTAMLKPFQEEATDAMLSKEFGVLCSPTGSGKTVMALHIVSQRKQPTLIIVHTKGLAFQWIDRITEFLGIPESEIGLIGAGKKKIGDKITVALVQSLYSRVEEVAPMIGHIITDECHRVPGRTFVQAVGGFDVKYMLGLSATPNRRDGLSKAVSWYMGDIHHTVGTGTLIGNGDILRAKVTFRNTNFKPYYDPVEEYSKMLSELVGDIDRNKLIAADVAKVVRADPGEICLVLTDRKNHCDAIGAILEHDHGIKPEIMTGDTPQKKRAGIFSAMADGKVGVLIATGQLIGEGFDEKRLSTLFMATPIKYSGRVIQYIGRVLRPAPGKGDAKIFDYIDVNVPQLVKSSMSRKATYRKQGARV